MKKAIGIVGGMGPQASNELYRLLIDKARRRYGAKTNDAYPEILIDSVPVPDFLSDTDQMERAAQMLEDRVRRLNDYGVSTLTMACNTACILIDRLQKCTSVPIISVIDEVVKHVGRDGFKVLLLASPTTLRTRLYQEALDRIGVSYVVTKQIDYSALEFIIRGVLGGKSRASLKQNLVKIVERYVEKYGVRGIVLGCTELPLVFPANYRLPTYSSLSILADALLKRYYTKEVL